LLVREKKLLRRPGGGSDIKLVYNGVVAELFPRVARMVPPGGQVLSFIDYTASRQLRQRDVLQQVPPKETPASLIFTLADDNVGVLPQASHAIEQHKTLLGLRPVGAPRRACTASVRTSYCQGYGPYNVSLPRSDKTGKILPAEDDADNGIANEATAASMCGCVARLPKVCARRF